MRKNFRFSTHIQKKKLNAPTAAAEKCKQRLVLNRDQEEQKRSGLLEERPGEDLSTTTRLTLSLGDWN